MFVCNLQQTCVCGGVKVTLRAPEPSLTSTCIPRRTQLLCDGRSTERALHPSPKGQALTLAVVPAHSCRCSAVFANHVFQTSVHHASVPCGFDAK